MEALASRERLYRVLSWQSIGTIRPMFPVVDGTSRGCSLIRGQIQQLFRITPSLFAG